MAIKKNIKNIKKYFPYIYILLLAVSFLYVRSVINEEIVEVQETDNENEKVEEVKPAVIYIQIYDQSSNLLLEERLRMENTDTLDDALEELYDQGKLKFEKNAYIFGDEYYEILDLQSNENYYWAVYENEKEVTYDLNELDLKDEATYKIALTKRP